MTLPLPNHTHEVYVLNSGQLLAPAACQTLSNASLKYFKHVT